MNNNNSLRLLTFAFILIVVKSSVYANLYNPDPAAVRAFFISILLLFIIANVILEGIIYLIAFPKSVSRKRIILPLVLANAISGIVFYVFLTFTNAFIIGEVIVSIIEFIVFKLFIKDVKYLRLFATIFITNIFTGVASYIFSMQYAEYLDNFIYEPPEAVNEPFLL